MSQTASFAACLCAIISASQADRAATVGRSDRRLIGGLLTLIKYLS